MPKLRYEDINLRPASLATIVQANTIIAEYAEQGFDLTLRQLYYQFVSRGYIANNDREYKKLGDIVSNGRMAGLIDWEAIVDRTRFIRKNTHWDSPSNIVAACAEQFQLDKWDSQPYYIEVWVEKDALIGVLEGVCTRLDVPYYACRGYNSMSEIWSAGRKRLRPKTTKEIVILYLGDHDPSGIDMTRDVEARLSMFSGRAINVERLALNFDQVQQYNPPPNPTKMLDTRSANYVNHYGTTCWELDALEPRVITQLIEDAVISRRDDVLWDETLEEERIGKERLSRVASEL